MGEIVGVSTVEHLLSAHEHCCGRMTSSELPWGMAGIPYDYDGDPELAMLPAKIDDELGTPTHATQDDYLPVYYATVNLVHYLHKGERGDFGIRGPGRAQWLPHHGPGNRRGRRELDRKVVVLASGGMSHTFWPLSQLP